MRKKCFCLTYIERLQPARGHQAVSWGHQSELFGSSYTQGDFYHEQAHGATAGTSMTVPPKSGNSGKKGKIRHCPNISVY